MRYCFDIDGTIFDTPTDAEGRPDYFNSVPIPMMLQEVNKLYDQGHYIIFFTARGRSSGLDWSRHTKEQLDKWGFKYNELYPMFCKPTADLFIDDKAINVDVWKRQLPLVKGIIAGAFDLIHPGYIRMMKFAKLHCNHLTIALHVDPSTERPKKLAPVHTTQERIEVLESIKYIDEISPYTSEEEFLSLLQNYQVRFLGTDYKDGSYTGKDLPIKIIWVDRSHKYSTTVLKHKVFASYKDHFVI
ncbi:adenylyltransferase/cytidyltransferase family protein [Prochlorococcus sp. MIT 1341]|uniref:adenylyltransferase/cytidyltransferase family protein n=1 Tax=Prochlorococcus sp. MIT 1341 TaxID=3096221 RepID=UPI002A75819A|nr:adenylyltransferase/cytidyltransferase family protein [Prochlorococcus sp. MIT 1341]